MKAIYKCRLCGETYQAGEPADLTTAACCMSELIYGICGTVPGAPTMHTTHCCGGDHTGSIGLADFQGWEKRTDPWIF